MTYSKAVNESMWSSSSIFDFDFGVVSIVSIKEFSLCVPRPFPIRLWVQFIFNCEMDL